MSRITMNSVFNKNLEGFFLIFDIRPTFTQYLLLSIITICLIQTQYILASDGFLVQHFWQIGLLISFFLLSQTIDRFDIWHQTNPNSFLVCGIFLLGIISIYNSGYTSPNLLFEYLSLPYMPFLYATLRRIPDRFFNVPFFCLLLFLIVFGHSLINENIFAWSVMGSMIIVFNRCPSLQILLTYIFSAWLLIFFRRWNACLALSILALKYSWKVAIGIISILILLIFIASRLFEPTRPVWHSRDLLWLQAIEKFYANPIWGTGYSFYLDGRLEPYSHNFALTIAGNFGIIGLFSLLLILIGIAQQWPRYPFWSKSIILFYGLVSFLDEPIQIFSTMLIFTIAITRTIQGDTNYSNSSIPNQL